MLVLLYMHILSYCLCIEYVALFYLNHDKKLVNDIKILFIKELVARGVQQQNTSTSEVMQELEKAIDLILYDDDTDRDGYINYFEYSVGIKR